MVLSVWSLFLWRIPMAIDRHFVNTLRPRQNRHPFPGDIFRLIFLNANVSFLLRFHWSLFLRFQCIYELTISQHWFRYWFGPSQATSHCLNQCWLVYERIGYTSFRLNELTHRTWDKMANISQTTFSNAVSSSKTLVFWLITIWYKFVPNYPTDNKSALVYDNGLAPAWRRAIIWTNLDIAHRYMSPVLNELITQILIKIMR